MKKTPARAVIVYCSPAGSTRRVAEVIETTLNHLTVPCVTADIGTAQGRESAARAVQNMDELVSRLIKHGAELVGEMVQYKDSYRLCYIRGIEGLLISFGGTTR